MHDTNEGITTRGIKQHDLKIEDIDPLDRDYKCAGRVFQTGLYWTLSNSRLMGGVLTKGEDLCTWKATGGVEFSPVMYIEMTKC